ncbi:ergot alkaloid biosynthesis protein, AFUA_2G17970 family [Rhizobium sp. RU33A]|uniref:NmrA family NAD(P)-binding protein n=1 Tax=Rhizobium sp. RU33A TaxID=1907413 RepID=UPI000954E266|nr:NmrA family NAD(P)-binding protein [Rhizobium sp. RU33A]SIQ36628.1 ergot alkaloid biosynthesis protein, AFUA_2G17970 family [Rhizobium sp. RU33A]
MSTQILVIGGKGKTGRLVGQDLLTRGVRTRIATRSPTEGGDVAFDWQDPRSADAAFDGVTSVYIVAPTNNSDHGTIVPPILEIARKRGVQRFVLLSASSLEAGGPMMGQIHAYLRDEVPEWTVLRPTWFMQNFSEQQHLKTILNEDAIYSATGAGRVGFIDAADIAKAAVSALLAETSWNRDFILTGPEALSYADFAEKISNAIDRKIKHVNLTTSELADRYARGGLNAAYAKILAEMDARISEGSEDRLSDGVFDLTGQPPTSAAEFISAHKNAWGRKPEQI